MKVNRFVLFIGVVFVCLHDDSFGKDAINKDDGCRFDIISKNRALWGWSFDVLSLKSKHNPDYIEHQLIAKNKGKSILLWTSFRALKFIKSVDFKNYEIVFFEHPLIRPFGNIILAFRVTPDEIPKLCFVSPYSPSIPIFYKVIDIKEKGDVAIVTLKMEGANFNSSTVIHIELSKNTLPLEFSSDTIDG